MQYSNNSTEALFSEKTYGISSSYYPDPQIASGYQPKTLSEAAAMQKICEHEVLAPDDSLSGQEDLISGAELQQYQVPIQPLDPALFLKQRETDGWSVKEEDLWLQGLQKYQRHWTQIAKLVGSRTAEQCRGRFRRSLRQVFAVIGSRRAELEKTDQLLAVVAWLEIMNSAMKLTHITMDDRNRLTAQLLERVGLNADPVPNKKEEEETGKSHKMSRTGSAGGYTQGIHAPLPPVPDRPKSSRCIIQLVPTDMTFENMLLESGFNPRLEIVVKKDKSVASMAVHVTNKWCTEALYGKGARLFPFGVPNHPGWDSRSDERVTLEQVYMSLGEPNPFRFNYVLVDMPASMLPPPPKRFGTPMRYTPGIVSAMSPLTPKSDAMTPLVSSSIARNKRINAQPWSPHHLGADDNNNNNNNTNDILLPHVFHSQSFTNSSSSSRSRDPPSLSSSGLIGKRGQTEQWSVAPPKDAVFPAPKRYQSGDSIPLLSQPPRIHGDSSSSSSINNDKNSIIYDAITDDHKSLPSVSGLPPPTSYLNNNNNNNMLIHPENSNSMSAMGLGLGLVGSGLNAPASGLGLSVASEGYLSDSGHSARSRTTFADESALWADACADVQSDFWGGMTGFSQTQD